MAPRCLPLRCLVLVFCLIEAIEAARGPDRGPNFFPAHVKFEQISKGPGPDRGPNYGPMIDSGPSSSIGPRPRPGPGRLRPQIIFPSGPIESASSFIGRGPPPFGPSSFKPLRDSAPSLPPGVGSPPTFPPGSRPSNVSPTTVPRPPFMSANFQAPFSNRPQPPVKSQFHPPNPSVKKYLRPPPLPPNAPPPRRFPQGPSKFNAGEENGEEVSQSGKQPTSPSQESKDAPPEKSAPQDRPQGASTNVQPVYGPPPGAAWAGDAGGDETFFEYVKQPAKGEYEFGFERGNPSHSVSRYEKGKNWKFRSKVSWKDKYAGSGLQVWEYNHVDKTKGKRGGGKHGPWVGGNPRPWAGGSPGPWAEGSPGPWAGGNPGPWAGGSSGPWAGGSPGPWLGGGSGPWDGGGGSNPWSDSGGPQPWAGELGNSDLWSGGGAGLEAWPGGGAGEGGGSADPWAGGGGSGPWSGGGADSNPWAGGGDSPWAEGGGGLGHWSAGDGVGGPWADALGGVGGSNPWASGGGGGGGGRPGGGTHSVWLGGSEPVTVGKYGGADTVMGGGYQAGGGSESGHGGYGSNGGGGWDTKGGNGGSGGSGGPVAGGPWRGDLSAGSYGSGGADAHGMTEAIFWRENGGGHKGSTGGYGDNPHEIDFQSLGNEWLQGDQQGYESRKQTETEKIHTNSTKDNSGLQRHKNVSSKRTPKETSEGIMQNNKKSQQKTNDKPPSNRKSGNTTPEGNDRDGGKKNEEEIDHSQFLPDASLLFGLTDRYYARAH